MERIRIDHDSGYLDLNIEAFFPCSPQKARKVFKLINRCCPYGDRAALRAELLELAKGYEAMCQMYEDKIHTPARLQGDQALGHRTEENSHAAEASAAEH